MLDNIFTPLDEHLSLLAAKLDKGASSLLPQIVKRLSAEVRDGSSCIDLSESIDTVNDLKKSSIVGNPGDDLPFILTEDSLLYLGRYYHYECVLSELLNKMASISFPKDSDTTLETIKDPEQKLAVQTALTKRLTIISGGPGTGKTWTAAQIIIALLKTGVSKVAVAAPTGKAANRLNESLQKTIPSELPETISTIHKLLGIRMDGSTRYHETNKLPYNSVIIDEASMVDLSTMCKLVSALNDDCRLILIGDRNQLASVETGSVLADICAAAEKTSNPLHGCFIELKNSYRFGNDSIIGAVSKLVREGDAESSYDLLSKNKLFISYHGKEELHRLIINECKEWLNEYRESLQSPTAAISKLSENKLLTVQHSGASGTIELNELFTRKLQKNRDSYHGIPIIITKNDADSALFNGDTGILLENSNDGSVNGYFSGLSSEIRSTPLSRLPDYSQAFALTVHKSQGSEYGKVHIVLPERGESRVLSRELIYTALTRAKKEIHVWGSKESWNAAISRPIKRKSGLLQLLQQAGTCSKKIL